VRDDVAWGELDFVDGLEALAQVGLHHGRVLGLGEYFEQGLVTQEEESGEVLALAVQLLVDLLLDAFEGVAAFGEEFLVLCALFDVFDEALVLVGLLHVVLPPLVLLLEGGGLGLQLLLDVLRVEHGLQLHPDLLELDPQLDHAREGLDLRAEVLRLVLDQLADLAVLHGLQRLGVLVQELGHVVDFLDDQAWLAWFLLVDRQFALFKCFADDFDVASDFPLLDRFRRNVSKFVALLLDIDVEDVFETDLPWRLVVLLHGVLAKWFSYDGLLRLDVHEFGHVDACHNCDLPPVFVLNGRYAELLDQRQLLRVETQHLFVQFQHGG